MVVGAQLYTLRDFTQTPHDIALTFKRVAQMGYKAVQVSAIGEIAPEKLNEIALENGVEIVLTHTNPKKILEDTQTVIKEHKIFGCKNVGIGSMPERYRGSLGGIKCFIEDYDEAAKIMANEGLKLHYHNHDFEFERFGGVRGFDYMVENTAADRWGFILDLYWVHSSGLDVAEYIGYMKGRIDILHFKDIKVHNGKPTTAAVYDGNMPYDKIIEVVKSNNIPYAMVEQDECNGENPFEMLRLSYENLKKKGVV